MKTFVVWFGPVPVTFTPEVTLYVGASGELAVGVRTGFETITTVTAGLQWKRGQGWSTISGFSNTRDVHAAASLRAGGVRAFAGLEAMLKIYYLAGPTAGLEAYLGLNADTDEDPMVGARRRAGRHARVQGRRDRLREHRNINLFEIPLVTANGGYKAKGLVSGRS